jgi:hypothetical protein
MIPFFEKEIMKTNLTCLMAGEVIVKLLNNSAFINQTDLIKNVSRVCNIEKESVRGGICGDASHKLYGQEWFKKDFAYVRKVKGVHGSRIYRKPLPEGVEEYFVSYNTNEKEKTRERIFSCIDNIEKPIIITMASSEGLDVKYILNQNENAKIYNIENNKDTLDKYEKLGLPTTNLFGNFNSKILDIKEKVDFVYYDTVGYACPEHEQSLIKLNDNLKPKYVAVTFINIKNFRGADSLWRRWAEEKFKSDDPTLEWIQYTMFNYKTIDLFEYNQNKDIGGRGMRVFVFELK